MKTFNETFQNFRFNSKPYNSFKIDPAVTKRLKFFKMGLSSALILLFSITMSSFKVIKFKNDVPNIFMFLISISNKIKIPQQCGLHRSKSISESQNTYLDTNPNPNGVISPSPVFKMQRASTQLSINHKAPLRHNLLKHYDDTVKLDEVKFKKSHEMQKNHRAPQPPGNNKIAPYRNSQQQKEVGLE